MEVIVGIVLEQWWQWVVGQVVIDVVQFVVDGGEVFFVWFDVYFGVYIVFYVYVLGVGVVDYIVVVGFDELGVFLVRLWQ